MVLSGAPIRPARIEFANGRALVDWEEGTFKGRILSKQGPVKTFYIADIQPFHAHRQNPRDMTSPPRVDNTEDDYEHGLHGEFTAGGRPFSVSGGIQKPFQ